MMRLTELQRLAAIETAARELARLSQCETTDPFTADRQAFIASELQDRAAKLEEELKEILDKKADSVRRIMEATR